MMNVRILDKKEDSMTFVVEGISTPMANTLRRIMLSEVPSMVIDDVVIIENLSVLHDENLALRLGLVPVKTDLDAYSLPEECSCQSELGCHLCRSILTMDVEAGDEGRIVYSGNLVPEDPNTFPVSREIPIVKLAPNQRVRLEAYARLGRGIDHAKWQPVTACTYRYMPTVRINKKNCDSCGDCVAICPKHVFGREGGQVSVLNEINCVLCGDCVDACPKDLLTITVKANEDAHIFFIESTGALPIERIVTEAFKIYDARYSGFLNQFEVTTNLPNAD